MLIHTLILEQWKVVLVVVRKQSSLSQQQFVDETKLMDLKDTLVFKLAKQDQNHLHLHVLKEMIQKPIQPVKSMDKMEMIWKYTNHHGSLDDMINENFYDLPEGEDYMAIYESIER